VNTHAARAGPTFQAHIIILLTINSVQLYQFPILKDRKKCTERFRKRSEEKLTGSSKG